MESNGNRSSTTGRHHSIVVYTWISFAELINFFDHAASEAFTGMKVVGL